MGAVLFCLTWNNTQNCSRFLLNAVIQLRGRIRSCSACQKSPVQQMYSSAAKVLTFAFNNGAYLLSNSC